MFSKGTNITSSHPQYFTRNISCQYSNAILSPNLAYYVHECLGPSIPYVAIRSLPANKLIRVIQRNDQLKDRAIEKAYPRIIKLQIPLAADNTPWAKSNPDNVSVELHLPPGLMEEETAVYPLVVLA